MYKRLRVTANRFNKSNVSSDISSNTQGFILQIHPNHNIYVYSISESNGIILLF